MIILLKPSATLHDQTDLLAKLEWMNFQAVSIEQDGKYGIAIVNGADALTDFQQFAAFPQVESVVPFKHKYKLASRELKKEPTVIRLGHCAIGPGSLTVMAGPCSIESEQQIHETAERVARAGATILRGGAFKPRTSPYDFQGLGEQGLRYMQAAAQKYGLLSISEVMDAQDVEVVAEYVDILQIGARNMQNFSLLKQIGRAGKPVMLKRGLSATYMDFLMAAEYILQTGNPNVILCERGIRTFETYTRNTLDIAAVPILKNLSHLPVIVDPSHGTGLRHLVAPMAYAAVAAGCDGIMVEVHPVPDQSVSDANQAISPQMFDEMMIKLNKIAELVCGLESVKS